MITDLPTTALESPTYYLVQYVPDPLRREASNVGVIVARGRTMTSRFFAEKPTSPGTIMQGEAKRRVLYPRIYEQWVKYWRAEIAKGLDGLKGVLEAEQINFQVITGGTVEHSGADRIDRIADELYLELVDAAKEMRPEKAGLSSKRLESDIRREFVKLKLTTKDMYNVHPIASSEYVAGKVTTHVPSFVQYNGRPYVMNAVGLSPSNSRRRMAEKTCATAYMFDDIHAKSNNAFTIAIVESLTDDKDEENRAEQILHASSDQVVHWNIEDERREFLEQREQIARASEL